MPDYDKFCHRCDGWGILEDNRPCHSCDGSERAIKDKLHAERRERERRDNNSHELLYRQEQAWQRIDEIVSRYIDSLGKGTD